ncbi:MAG TPA: hypothetical protein VI997_04010, partial [Candidatus Thermoplasmatota archaeon]|nr:hypothetical protein [Candidatus Thermoplasmatota archaeon]
HQVPVSVPARWTGGFETGSRVVFFGNSLGVECQQCGAYNSTSTGHRFCAQITCPIAVKEYKRRKRRRTSTLEQVYIPRKREEMLAAASAEEPAEAWAQTEP